MLQIPYATGSPGGAAGSPGSPAKAQHSSEKESDLEKTLRKLSIKRPGGSSGGAKSKEVKL